MTKFFIETTLTTTSQAPQIALVNPVMSGKTLTLRSVRLFGGTPPAMHVERYDVEATLSLLGPDAPVPMSPDSEGATSAVTVATTASHDITEPGGADLTFQASLWDENAGEALPLEDAVVLPAGSSILIETSNAFGGTGPTITFQVSWDET